MPRPTSPLLRKQLIEAAIELFIEKGFNQVTTRDLAERAGLSRSHLYLYFSDWKELQKAAFTEFASQELANVDDILAIEDKHDAVLSLIICLLPAKQDTSWKLWIDLWNAAQHDEEMARLYIERQQKWPNVLASLLDAGQQNGVFSLTQPARSARQIVALLNGYADLLRLDENLREETISELLEGVDLLIKPDRSFQNAVATVAAGLDK
ncbi:TetR/AcrR family transcriptional regulator [Deefgea sp. CFH1-16]|uniref:TetR/AcrR family transcriptional regulator n=1 Tax=Deefgea sp. CFH1-16 TaxID=2675457 RepID=UPI0015F3D841|nr:TetR/AcrR family transcriptional regulator [Deefgea sp. CFH1-16]MBM5575264.1 TetR family transcriptional regulator [Deefgea sp. CFH1-16]